MNEPRPDAIARLLAAGIGRPSINRQGELA